MKHTFTLTVDVDPHWITYLTRHCDIFLTTYSGYWLRGLDHDDALGWLCWESNDKCPHGEEPDREKALKAWRAGEELPPHWFRIDRQAALRAWEEGVKRWGSDWRKADREDTVIQLALLGEVKYE